MKEFADDNYKFDENGGKFSKSVENAVGKGEIARCEQFLFSLSVYKRLLLQTRKNQDFFGKGLIFKILWWRPRSESHSSVSSIVDLRTGSHWFDPRLGQYSLRGLIIVTVTGFIPPTLLSVVLTMVMWESSHWLGKNMCRVLVKRTPGKHG